MNYRKFGKLDFMPSALGFGLMRLPLKDKEQGLVDVEETIRIVRYAIDHGVNYLDTAYVYHKFESERILSEILKDGYRDKVKIATKFPLWNLQEEADLDKIFFEQLDKLKVKKIDFYLLHALNVNTFKLVKKFNMTEWLEKKRQDGYIDYIGFSFHDKLSVFKKIVDYYDWDFCQIQYNIIDVKNQAGMSGLKYAHKKGLGVIIMEPLRGGQLTQSVSDDIMENWNDMALEYSKKAQKTFNKPNGSVNQVQFLLDWLWNQEEVGLILSGMSDFSQTEQNVSFAEHSQINKFNKKQSAIIKKVQKMYQEKILIPCTGCNYCRVCPSKVGISYIFNLANEIVRFDNVNSPKMSYNFIPEIHRANKCVNCKVCLEHCPQQLNIPELIAKCKAVFEDNKPFSEVFPK